MHSTFFNRTRYWFEEKILEPARTLTQYQFSLSAAVGIWGGIFPIPAMTTVATLIITSVIFVREFNPAMTGIALAVNFLLAPMQLLCMPLFLGIPSRIAGLPSCNFINFLEWFKTKKIYQMFSSFGLCMLWAAITWAVLAPVCIKFLRVSIEHAAQVMFIRTELKKSKTSSVRLV